MLSSVTNVSLAKMAYLMVGPESPRHFVVAGHVNPDGDCLGSQLALSLALQACGKEVTCVLGGREPVAALFRFLPGVAAMVPAADFKGPVDAFVAVDVSAGDRLGASAELLGRAHTSFVVDHHLAERPLGEFSYIDPDSPSASLLVWELARQMVVDPTPDIALCAFTGLMTDTGGFRFQNATVRAFRGAADLVLCGADPAFVATRVFQSRTRASLALEAVALDRLQVFSQGAGALSFVTLADMAACNARKSDTEPLVDAVRSLAGVRVACMLREHEGFVRGSLRAKDATDVAALARTLEGGGHVASAGFTLHMPMNQAVPFMVQKIEDLLKMPVEA